jgi:hypothetical protein
MIIELDEAEKKLLALAFMALNNALDDPSAPAAIAMLATKLGVDDELDKYADEIIQIKIKGN